MTIEELRQKLGALANIAESGGHAHSHQCRRLERELSAALSELEQSRAELVRLRAALGAIHERETAKRLREALIQAEALLKRGEDGRAEVIIGAALSLAPSEPATLCGAWSASLAGACDLPKGHGGMHVSKGDGFYAASEPSGEGE